MGCLKSDFKISDVHSYTLKGHAVTISMATYKSSPGMEAWLLEINRRFYGATGGWEAAEEWAAREVETLPMAKRPLPPSLWIASVGTRHFEFEGAGDSEAAARLSLFLGLRKHAHQRGIPEGDAWAKETAADANCHAYRAGQAFRDGELL